LTEYTEKFKYTIRVRWSECDVQGVVYYGVYLDYIHVVMDEYFRNLGFLLMKEEGRKILDLAAVKASLEYKFPARIDDLVDLRFSVLKIGNSSVTTNVSFFRSDDQKLLTTGEIIYVNFNSETGKARKVPDAIRQIVNNYENTTN
jgi:acyl-CoA thioester hydrolase